MVACCGGPGGLRWGGRPRVGRSDGVGV